MSRRRRDGKHGTEAFQFEASVDIQAADSDSEAVPSFEAVAYNGGPLRVAKHPLPVVIDLAGLEMSSDIKANMDHDATQRVGHITDAQNTGKKILLAGRLSGTGDAANEVIANHRNGYPWQLSVEAKPTAPLQEIKAGRSVNVNGQTISGPVLVARKSRLYGVAFLSRGADEETRVAIAAAAVKHEELDMKFAEWIEASGFDVDVLEDKQVDFLQERYDAEVKASEKPGEPVPIKAAPFDLDELKAAYARHEAKIEAVCFEYAGKVESSKHAEIKAGAYEKAIELKRDALQKEWSADQFEVAAIRASSDLELEYVRSEMPIAPAIHASSKDATNEIIEAAMCMSLGVDVEKDYDEKTIEAAHKNFRRIGLQEVIILAAEANGYHGRSRINQGNLRDVLGYALPPAHIHASSNSTVSLSGILSNTANKELLMGFMEEDQTWREVSEVKPVSDFKTVTSYRMLDDMEYEKLGPNGEIAHGKLGEETFTRSADTYAKMMGITRTQIINDDLGAFDDLRTRLGRGAARKFRRLFWETFINNSSFFTTARTNYITGGTTNLGTDGVGLQLGITAYRQLKSTDKKQVGKKQQSGSSATSIGAPALLLVPPELEFTADKLFVSSNLSTQQDDNIHRNKYRPVVVNELSDSDYTGNSATAWYLFGTVLKPVVVSFLNGVENPTVESADADFNQLGIQFRGYHDFGVDQAEWLSGIKSKGAA